MEEADALVEEVAKELTKLFEPVVVEQQKAATKSCNGFRKKCGMKPIAIDVEMTKLAQKFVEDLIR